MATSISSMVPAGWWSRSSPEYAAWQQAGLTPGVTTAEANAPSGQLPSTPEGIRAGQADPFGLSQAAWQASDIGRQFGQLGAVDYIYNPNTREAYGVDASGNVVPGAYMPAASDTGFFNQALLMGAGAGLSQYLSAGQAATGAEQLAPTGQAGQLSMPNMPAGPGAGPITGPGVNAGSSWFDKVGDIAKSIGGTKMGENLWTQAGMQLAGSLLGAQAAKSAAQTQAEAMGNAAAQQRAMFDIINQQQAPYREAGYGALTRINEMLPSLTSMPTAADIQSMPGYQFGLEQGLGSVSQGLNVLSPGANVDRSRMKFATDYALQQGLPAYLKQRESIYNILAGISGLGQVSTGQTTQAATQTGTSLANMLANQGTALAGGTVGAANAISGGLQNIGNAQMLYDLINRQQPSSTYTAPNVGYGSSYVDLSNPLYTPPGKP